MRKRNVDGRPECVAGSVRLSDLIRYHARSFGGALYLYHVLIPTLRKSGRLIVDCPEYPAPTLSAE